LSIIMLSLLLSVLIMVEWECGVDAWQMMMIVPPPQASISNIGRRQPKSSSFFSVLSNDKSTRSATSRLNSSNNDNDPSNSNSNSNTIIENEQSLLIQEKDDTLNKKTTKRIIRDKVKKLANKVMSKPVTKMRTAGVAPQAIAELLGDATMEATSEITKKIIMMSPQKLLEEEALLEGDTALSLDAIALAKTSAADAFSMAEQSILQAELAIRSTKEALALCKQQVTKALSDAEIAAVNASRSAEIATDLATSSTTSTSSTTTTTSSSSSTSITNLESLELMNSSSSSSSATIALLQQNNDTTSSSTNNNNNNNNNSNNNNKMNSLDISTLDYDDVDYHMSEMAPPYIGDDQCLVPGEPVVRVEKAPENSRRIFAGIDIMASVDDVWNVLTDYENLQNVCPNLSLNQVLELYDVVVDDDNVDGDGDAANNDVDDAANNDDMDSTRIINTNNNDHHNQQQQETNNDNGKNSNTFHTNNYDNNNNNNEEQNIEQCKELSTQMKGAKLKQTGRAKVVGINFSARTTLEVREWPHGMPDFLHFNEDVVYRGESLSERVLKTKLQKLQRYKFPRPFAISKLPTKDISMQSVEEDDGEFRLYQGVWRMQPLPGCAPPGTSAMRLTYAVELSPRPYLPVALVEKRISQELCNNLMAIRDYVSQ